MRGLALFGFFWFIFTMGFLAMFLFALVDCIRSEFEGSNKVVWILLIIFIPVLGSILYLAIGRKQKKIKPIEESQSSLVT